NGDSARAEQEFTEGIALAEAIGEVRLTLLLKGCLAVLQADQASSYGADQDDGTTISESSVKLTVSQRLLNEALETALHNFRGAENLDLIYSRFEAHRCLAEVRFRRGEFDEAERLCAAASELVSETDSRVSRLWLGPLYIEVLLAASRRAEAEGKFDEAAAKRDLAAEHLARYQALVADCQSPRFTGEAAGLQETIAPFPKAAAR